MRSLTPQSFLRDTGICFIELWHNFGQKTTTCKTLKVHLPHRSECSVESALWPQLVWNHPQLLRFWDFFFFSNFRVSPAAFTSPWHKLSYFLLRGTNKVSRSWRYLLNHFSALKYTIEKSPYSPDLHESTVWDRVGVWPETLKWFTTSTLDLLCLAQRGRVSAWCVHTEREREDNLSGTHWTQATLSGLSFPKISVHLFSLHVLLVLLLLFEKKDLLLSFLLNLLLPGVDGDVF